MVSCNAEPSAGGDHIRHMAIASVHGYSQPQALVHTSMTRGCVVQGGVYHFHGGDALQRRARLVRRHRLPVQRLQPPEAAPGARGGLAHALRAHGRGRSRQEMAVAGVLDGGARAAGRAAGAVRVVVGREAADAAAEQRFQQEGAVVPQLRDGVARDGQLAEALRTWWGALGRDRGRELLRTAGE